MSTASLLWGVLFGSIGVGFLMYARKQQAIVPLFCGVALIGFPYFVDNGYLQVAIGGALIAIPYFFRF